MRRGCADVWHIVACLIVHIISTSQAELCQSVLGGSVIVVDILESFGTDFNQSTYPAQLPIEGDLSEISLTVQSADNGADAGSFMIQGKSLGLTRPIDRDLHDITSVVLRVRCEILHHHHAGDDDGEMSGGSLPVIVRVLDINDNAPLFFNLPYVTTVAENVSPGSVIFAGVQATDRDAGLNALIKHVVVAGDSGATDGYGSFVFDESRPGVISVARQLDFEKTDVYFVTIVAHDMTLPEAGRRSSTATLTVHIQDSDDLDPVFVGARCAQVDDLSCQPPVYHAQVRSGIVEGVLDVQPSAVHAVDGDSLGFDIEYSIVAVEPEQYGAHWHVQPRTGHVTQTRAIKHAQVSTVKLLIQATEISTASRSSTAELLVHVQRGHDEVGPVVTSTSDTGYVWENSGVGTLVMSGDISDSSNASNSTTNSSQHVLLRLTDEYQVSAVNLSLYTFHLTSDMFGVNDRGYLIVTRPDLDCDPPSPSILTLQIVVREKYRAWRVSAPLTLRVKVLDTNDHVPRLPVFTTIRVPATNTRTPVVQVLADDPDTGQWGQVSYSVLAVRPDSGQSRVYIDPRSGQLYIDPGSQQGQQWTITVQARDGGDLWSSGDITVLVVAGSGSAGDAARSPVFSQSRYNISVPENSRVGTVVLSVLAVDPDQEMVSYCIVEEGTVDDISETIGGRLFSVATVSGAVTVDTHLDRETDALHKLIVRATDPGGLWVDAEVTIHVTDINDNPPRFNQSVYEVFVEEGGAPNILTRVQATDADSAANAQVHYSILNNSNFTIHPQSGTVSSLIVLDFETQKLHNITLVASDGDVHQGALSSSCSLLIHVTDRDDHVPVFQQRHMDVQLQENLPPGTVVTTVHALDVDTVAFIHYMITEGPTDLFTIDRNSGVVSTVHELDCESSVNHLLLVSTEQAVASRLNHSVTINITVLDVNDLPPVFVDLAPTFWLTWPLTSGHLQVGSVRAVDDDVTSPNNQVRYSTTDKHVIIHEISGDISLIADLVANVSQTQQLHVRVTASDLGTPVLSSSTTVRLLLMSPTHKHNNTTSTKPEGRVMFSGVDGGAVSVHLWLQPSPSHDDDDDDDDSVVATLPLLLWPPSQHVFCSIRPTREAFYAALSEDGSLCQVKLRSRSRLVVGRHELEVTVRSAGGLSLTEVIDTAKVEVTVGRGSSFTPRFSHKAAYNQLMSRHVYVACVLASDVISTTPLITVHASVERGGLLSRIFYSIERVHDLYRPYFTIDSQTGAISTNFTSDLGREMRGDTVRPLELTIKATAEYCPVCVNMTDYNPPITNFSMSSTTIVLVNLAQRHHVLMMTARMDPVKSSLSSSPSSSSQADRAMMSRAGQISRDSEQDFVQRLLSLLQQHSGLAVILDAESGSHDQLISVERSESGEARISLLFYVLDPVTAALLPRNSRAVFSAFLEPVALEKLSYYMWAVLRVQLTAIEAPLAAERANTSLVLAPSGRGVTASRVTLAVLACVSVMLVLLGCAVFYWCRCRLRRGSAGHTSSQNDRTDGSGSDQPILVAGRTRTCHRSTQPYTIYETQVLCMDVPCDNDVHHVKRNMHPTDAHTNEPGFVLSANNIGYIGRKEQQHNINEMSASSTCAVSAAVKSSANSNYCSPVTSF